MDKILIKKKFNSLFKFFTFTFSLIDNFQFVKTFHFCLNVYFHFLCHRQYLICDNIHILFDISTLTFFDTKNFFRTFNFCWIVHFQFICDRIYLTCGDIPWFFAEFTVQIFWDSTPSIFFTLLNSFHDIIAFTFPRKPCTFYSKVVLLYPANLIDFHFAGKVALEVLYSKILDLAS